jgi:hypothetical protein
VQQQGRLRNLRLADDIHQEPFVRKSTELRDPARLATSSGLLAGTLTSLKLVL